MLGKSTQFLSCKENPYKTVSSPVGIEHYVKIQTNKTSLRFLAERNG